MTPKTTCDKCHGSGKTSLDKSLTDVLALMGRNEWKAEGLHFHIRDEVTVNAINNRLKRLHEHGLVTRRRSGKFWLYRTSRAKK